MILSVSSNEGDDHDDHPRPQRGQVLTRLLAGELDIGEAAVLMELPERQAWRLKRAFLERGPDGLVHGNRGRASARRLGGALRARVVELARTRNDKANADPGRAVDDATGWLVVGEYPNAP